MGPPGDGAALRRFLAGGAHTRPNRSAIPDQLPAELRHLGVGGRRVLGVLRLLLALARLLLLPLTDRIARRARRAALELAQDDAVRSLPARLRDELVLELLARL